MSAPTSSTPVKKAKQPASLALLARYHRALVWGFLLWLGFRLVVLPWVMAKTLGVSDFGSYIVWQVLVLLPVVCLTPVLLKGKSAYGLIVASLVLMVYWGAAASFWLIRWYENAPLPTVAVSAFETVLLAWVLVRLFLLLKKMPAMHTLNRR